MKQQRAAHGTRREFLASAGAIGAAVLLPGALQAQEGTGEPLFRISLAQWSLHRALYAGDLDNLDFARIAREQYGIAAVEYVSGFFPDKAVDFDYLAEMKKRAAQAGVQSLLIMIDGEGRLAATDEEERALALENHFKWIAAARFLGCHSIRVNAAGDGEREEVARRAAASLKRLGRIGDQYGVNVLVENHGGLSSDGAWLADVIRRADHPRVGTLPDFGNFHLGGDDWYDRYQGVIEMMPFAKAVSAKSHDFDAEGNEEHTDFRRMLQIVLAAGYHGHVGIEYEGGALSEEEGIRKTKALLERVRDELRG